MQIGEDLYADGGITSGLDIAAAAELGATTVVAIDLRPTLSRQCPRNVVEVLTRSLEILGETRSACAIEHMTYGQTALVHIQPGLVTQDRSGFRDVRRLLEESYITACQVFDQCWDGSALAPGHYHPAGTLTVTVAQQA